MREVIQQDENTENQRKTVPSCPTSTCRNKRSQQRCPHQPSNGQTHIKGDRNSNRLDARTSYAQRLFRYNAAKFESSRANQALFARRTWHPRPTRNSRRTATELRRTESPNGQVRDSMLTCSTKPTRTALLADGDKSHRVRSQCK